MPTYSRLPFYAFEQAISGDLNRMQALDDRDEQDLYGNRTRTNYDYNTNTFQVSNCDFIPEPVPGADILPILTPVIGSFDMLISGDNSGLTASPAQMYMTSPIGAPDTDSSWNLVNRLSTITQTLVFAPPSGSPRIDLVVAEPSSVLTDAVNRNILVDPMTRTVVVQQEFKTSNPVSIVTVITGTPSPNNIASYNLVTANQQVLFEVYVPVGATDSDDFLVQRQLFTRIEGPMANYHGIIRGVQIFNNFGIPGARDGTADAGPPNFAPDIVNQIVIDGQHIHWSGYGGIGIPDDLPGQNPMVVGFNAIQDIAYYMYLVGGRNNKNVSGIFNPQTSGIVDGFGSPVVLVFSNVPPLGDQSCYPSAPIGIPDRISGSTMSVRKGALFVGCGFRVKNTAFHKGCEWVGSWVHAAGGNYTAGGNNFLIAFNDAPSGIPYRTLSTTVNVAVPINTWPQVALRAKVAVYSEHGSTGSAAAVYTIGYAGTAANTVAGQQISVVPATTITAYDMVEADDPNLVASPIFPNTETLKIIVQATSFQVALHRYGEVNS